jgi:hypothetical protein
MPDPIVPIHKMNDHDGLFNVQIEGLSDMQQQLLGGPRTAAKKTYSSQTLNSLERIYKSKDELLSTAQSHLNRTAEDIEIFSVPTNINDYELLGLKTEGLIVGSGRAVKLTEAGRTALRDFWLKSANQEKVNRESPKFDYKAALDKYQSIRGVAENSNTGRVAQASTKGRFKK